MRVRVVVVLAAMPMLLGAWTLSSEDHMRWNPRGQAVVKTPDGVSHVIRGRSACNFGTPTRAGRLRFGGTPTHLPYMSIVVRKLKGNPAVLNIEDGILRVAPNFFTIAVLGTAHIQDGPVRPGTFVLFRHKGGGVTGKARYTGSWKCG